MINEENFVCVAKTDLRFVGCFKFEQNFDEIRNEFIDKQELV